MTRDEWMPLWLATRDEAVSLLAERLLQRPARPLLPKSLDSTQKAARWLAAAQEVNEATLGGLLESLDDGFSDAVLERLKLVATWPEDPRVSAALARLWERPTHVNVSTLFLWEALAEEQVRRADPRSLHRLRALRAMGAGWVGVFRPHMRPHIAPLLEKTIAALEAAVAALPLRALTTAERARLDGTRPALGREELLATVWASPDDDGTRLVCADALSAAGDPQGEFITLQCLAQRTPAQEERCAELVKRHGKAWAQPLSKLGRVDAWERGFPAAFTVTAKSKLAIGPLLGHPAWRTVHTLAPAGFTSLLVHPAMTRVERVLGLTAADVRALSKYQRSWPFRSLVSPWFELADAFPLLARREAFPHLREVRIDPGHRPTAETADELRGAIEALLAARPELHVALGPGRLAPLTALRADAGAP